METSSTHGTLLLLLDGKLNALLAEDVAAFGDDGLSIGGVDHLFKADGTLAVSGRELVDKAGMESAAHRRIERSDRSHRCVDVEVYGLCRLFEVESKWL